MRMKRLLALSTALFSLNTMACSDLTAPPLDAGIVLAPFSNEVMQIHPKYSCENCSFGNSMKFYAPIGIDPIIEYSIRNISGAPGVSIRINRTPDPDNVCTKTTCTQTPWTVYIEVSADKVGEAEVTFFLRSNPDKKSPVRVVSAEYLGGKG
jgi:hypothetical protein